LLSCRPQVLALFEYGVTLIEVSAGVWCIDMPASAGNILKIAGNLHGSHVSYLWRRSLMVCLFAAGKPILYYFDAFFGMLVPHLRRAMTKYIGGASKTHMFVGPRSGLPGCGHSLSLSLSLSLSFFLSLSLSRARSLCSPLCLVGLLFCVCSLPDRYESVTGMQH
jgi:hypothetical protein